MAERWPDAVILDLDGTLIDSAGDIADALNAAVEQTGLAPFSEAQVRLMVGGGTRVLIERALDARAATSDRTLVERLHARFMEVYQTASIARTLVHRHGRELLAGLSGAGVRLAVCTNKPAGITEDVLAKLGLRTSFQAVVGGTDALPKKPHPAMLAAVLSTLGVPREGAVMIGDSGADVGAARAAGLPVIVVSFGYSRIPADELGADLVIDSLADAAGAIRDLQNRAC